MKRDGAQVAAHDLALRAELLPLSSTELVERSHQLEQRCQELDRAHLERRIAQREDAVRA